MKKQFTSMKSFIHEITFPNGKQVKTNVLNVFLMSGIIGAFVWIADFTAMSLVDMLLNAF